MEAPYVNQIIIAIAFEANYICAMIKGRIGTSKCLTATATVRRIVNMTALTVAAANAAR